MNKSPNIYIITCTDGTETLVKLGYSSNIYARFKAYDTHNPFYKVLETLHLPDAKVKESLIHQLYSDASTHAREWYPIDMLNPLRDALSYDVNVLRRMLKCKLDHSQMLHAIRTRFPKGSIVPAREVKSWLNQNYNINVTGREIRNYCEVEEKATRIDGKVTWAYHF